MASDNTGFKRAFLAARYSWQGLKDSFKYESAFRQELLLLLITTPLAFWLAENKIELILMIGSVILVLAFELVNTAVENVVDNFGKEWSVLCGRAKDAGSAAVLVALVFVGLVWGGILFGDLLF